MPTLTPPQLLQARAELGWSQRQLAAAANLAVSTVAEFERGVRTPTAANLDAMRAALAGAGIVFAEDGGPEPRLMRPGNAPLPGGLAWSLITATDFARWTGLQPQGLLPHLIELLVGAGAGAARRLCRFPWDDSVQHSGPDGEVEIDPALFVHPPEFLPQGRSLWELTTQSGALFGKSGKASLDAGKRREPLSAEEAAATTFVFVTTQRVPHKTREAWVKARKAADGWHDVRVIDADALASWVNQFPAVLAWLAEKMDKPWAGCRRLEDAWNDWIAATHPPLSGDFLLLGRDEAAAKVWTWLHRDGTDPLFIEGETVEEVFAFVAASLRALPSATADALMARAVIADTTEQARRLAHAPLPHLLLCSGIDPQHAHAAARRGHRVIAAYPSRGSGFTLTGAILLPPPRRFELQQLLEAALPGEAHPRRAEAARLAKGAGGSLGILRRHLMPESQNPKWVASAQAPSLRAALLVGAWDQDNPQDRAVLSDIAGRPYEELERDLIQWAEKPGDPLRKIGHTWKLAAPRDAFFLLAPCLTGGELDRFTAAALSLLGTPGPLLARAPDQRWQAAIGGLPPRCSAGLRQGLCETIALLAILPDRVRPAEADAAARAARIVRTLLHKADAARWLSLSDHLMTLAEAAPDAFLEAIEASLQQRESASVLALLRDDLGRYSGQQCAHLLWALEILSSDRDFIGRIGRILAQLVRLGPRPESHWLDTPAASLAEIFAIDLPRSPLPWRLRFDTLRGLLENDIDLADVFLGTLFAILPSGPRIVTIGPFAAWREFDVTDAPELPDDRRIPASYWMPAATEVSNLIVDRIRPRPELWPKALETSSYLMPEARAALVETIRSEAAHINDEAQRAALRDALQSFIARHRRFADSGWAFPETDLIALEETLDRLAPADPIRRHHWLFTAGAGDYLDPAPLDWQANHRKLETLRAEALADIWRQGGEKAICDLLEISQRDPSTVGFAIGAADIPESVKREFAKADFLNDAVGYPSIAAGIIWASRADREAAHLVGEWLESGGREGWPARALARILRVLPSAPSTWQLAQVAGGDTENEYWRQVHGIETNLRERDVETYVRKMLAAGRAAAALHNISLLYRNRVAPETLRDLLLAAAKEESEAQGSLLERYHVEPAFDVLHRSGAIGDEELAGLELKFLHHLLGPGPAKPLAIHRVMARDPARFCEVLSYVYRPADGEQEAAQDAARTPQDRHLSQLYWNILHTWRTVPGLRDGVVDRRALEDWITGARQRCQEAGLLPACDFEIGRLLAQAPPDAEDGIWPCRAVREMLRVFGSERIEDGLYTGEMNRRGVTSRGLHDGGAQERALAGKYGRWASELAIPAPRAATVLRRIARDYEEGAKREDEMAALHD